MARVRVEPEAGKEQRTATRREEIAEAVGPRATVPRLRHGTVKWFSEAKGYGFIKADDGTDAFVHRSAISAEGFRTLSEGQPVSYEEIDGAKGLLAMNVVPTVMGFGASRR